MINPTPKDFAELRRLVAEAEPEPDLDAGRRFGQAFVRHHDDGGDELGWWDSEMTAFIVGMIDGFASDEIRRNNRETGGDPFKFVDGIIDTDLPDEVREAIYMAIKPFMNPPVIADEYDDG